MTSLLDKIFVSDDLLSHLITLLFSNLAELLLYSTFIALVVLEIKCPKFQMSYQQWWHSMCTNLSLFLFNSVVLSLLSIPLWVWLADVYAQKGLLSLLPDGPWIGLLAFLLFDLLLYFWHRVCHNVDFFWIFHRVHHSDIEMNVSTAFRVHLLEVLLGLLLKSAYVVILGVDKLSIIIFEVITTLFVMMHHANIKLPAERFLGRILIMPSQHRVHHSQLRAQHDNNYGSVLSVWDRVFGTYLLLEPKAYGIKGCKQLGFVQLLKFGIAMPAPISVANKIPAEKLHSMVADAAYYRALNRGFTKEQELDDWLLAEQEILNRIKAQNKARKNGLLEFLGIGTTSLSARSSQSESEQPCCC